MSRILMGTTAVSSDEACLGHRWRRYELSLSLTPSHISYTLAGATLAGRKILSMVGVCLVKQMAANAVGLPSMNARRAILGKKAMVTMLQHLQMIGVDARRNAAEMMEVHALCNRPSQEFVDYTVNKGSLMRPDANYAMPRSLCCTCPEPAGVRLFHLRPKSLLQSAGTLSTFMTWPQDREGVAMPMETPVMEATQAQGMCRPATTINNTSSGLKGH